LSVIESPGERWSAGNPTPVLDRDTGRLWLHYLRCQPNRGVRAARPTTDELQNLVRYSDDHGQTWSDAIDITPVCRDMNDAQWCATITGPGGSAVQDCTGRLIVPCWKWPYAVFALISEDHGRTWQRGQFVPGGIGNENQLVELPDGRIMMDFRQEAGKSLHRWIATSSDGAHTWSAARPGQEVQTVCCALDRWPADASSDKPSVLVWSGPKGPGRRHLVVRFSHDMGQTFPIEKLITSELAAYSDLARIDRRLGLLWERGAGDEPYRIITYTPLEEAFLSV
jgi:sialidase-1